MSNQILSIPSHLVDPGPNDRQKFDAEKLNELAQSIKQNGLAQPPVLRQMANGRYEIVAGERRTRAMTQVLGWAEIPAIVRDLSDEQAAEIMLAENVQREDLTPMEEAQAYQSRMHRFGWNVKEVAARAKVSESVVKNRLALLTLIPEARQLIEAGQLGVGFGETLAALDVARQRVALKWLNDQKGLPSQKVFSQFVGQLLAHQNQDSLFDLTLFSGQAMEAKVAEAGGKLAKLLPRLPELPAVPSLNVSPGELFDQYAAALLDAGFEREARVILDFWAKVLEGNYMRLSAYRSEVLKRHGEKLLEVNSAS